MENSKTFILKKLTAFAMAFLMVFTAGLTPVSATDAEEEQEAEYIASVGETLYESLQEAVNEAENGATVILTADAEGDGVIVPEGKEIIFDFGGFTYTVSGKLVGSAGTETSGMQLLRDAEVTLKNGTLKAGGEVKILVQNYSDLTVDDFNLEGDGALYALSNNCGDILVTGESNISCDNTAFDLWYNLQGNYPEGVSVTFDENFTGTVDGMIEYGADVAADGWFEKTALTVKNGTFDGAFLKSSDFDFSQANIVLYGGTFIDPRVENFCAEDYKVIEDGERFRVVPNNYIVSDAKGNKYESLQEAVEAAESEAVLTLLADASGDGVVVPEGKEIIFDFGGFTYTVDGKLVGSAGTETQAMQLLKGARVTLKNGTLKAGKDVKFLVQNYSDLTVENMLLDVTGVDYQYAYALSNNCGNVTVRGKTDISSDYVAFDLWYNLIGAYSEGVNVTFDETFTGTVKGDIEYGAYAVAEGWTEKTALVIKGGTFLGEIRSSSDFEDKANITAYAGTFSDSDIADYCAEHFKAVADGENYKVVPKDYKVTSTDGKEYETLQEAVDAAEGETVLTLKTDIEGDGIFVPSDKEITVDFEGFTYTVNGALVGSEGSETQGMHLGRGAVVTLKNGTFKADRDMKILVQNYCDLTLENVTLDAENVEGAYALSNNFGKVTVKGESNILSKNVAFDLYYNMMGAYSEGVSVTFDEDFTGTVSGDIEYGAEVLTENWTEKTALVIRGGTFLGEIILTTEADKANITAYAGTFSDADVSEYCAEDYKLIEDGENYKVIPKEYIVSSADGKKYESIQEAVDSTEGEATLTFLCDAEGDGIFVAENKEITLDFGGFTYTVNGELVGSEGSETQGMHLGKGAKVTLRNGTLKAGRDMKILVQNYCDLTLENVTLDAENVEGAYALSNNFGKVTVKGESNILSKNVAFDLYYNMMGAYSEGVSVTFDEDFTGTVSGDIEYGAEVLTENWTEKTALVIRGGTFLGEIINLNENELYAGDMNIVLYGGSFLKPVFEDWCAEGSEPAVFDDGTYGPCFHEFTEKIEDRDHFRAEPDCEKGNVYYYDCSKCVKMGAETFDDGAKLGHSFSAYIPNNDGTCSKDPTATAVCDREGCNGTDTVIFEGTAKHGWGEWTTVKAASCTVNGAEERYCDLCGAREERAVSAKHTYSEDFITDTEAVCGKAGSKSRHCIYCDAKTDVTSIPAKTHINKETVTPATDKGPGYIKTTCTLCGKTSSKKIYRIQTFKLSKTSYTYTGKAFKPSVTVKDYKGKVLVNGKDYTVKYSKNKAIGKGKVIITFKGNYTGTKTLEFSINPAKVGSLKLTAKNDAMGLSWKTVKGADGYQISYSTSKKFTKKTTKTTYIKKQKTKKTTLKKLKNATKYYVRIRAYKKVSGKNVYGAYSSVNSVKVK